MLHPRPLIATPQPFMFRHFQLSTDGCAMKVGTDAMVLGSWVVPLATETRILDIGTGSGVLALMAAQRATAHSTIDAVELDAAAAAQAALNFGASPWAGRLTAHHTTFQDFVASRGPGGAYDLLLSNPPFFEGGSKANIAARAAARHADVTLPFADLAAGAAALMHATSRLCVVLPPAESQAFLSQAAGSGLALRRRLRVRSWEGDTADKRHLLELVVASGAGGGVGEVREEALVLRECERRYSDAYRALTIDFHPPGAV